MTLLPLGEGVLDFNEVLSHVAQHILPGARVGEGLFSFPLISNHIIMQVVAAALIVWLIPRAVRMRAGSDEIGRLVPRGVGNAIESLCDAIRVHVAEPNLGSYTSRYLPYLWSTFFFILTCNVLGMLPLTALSDLILGHAAQHQLGGTSTGNIYVTGALAILTLILMVASGLRFHGLAYVKHFFMGPVYMAWFIAILEMAGLLFKTMALAVRLFANMIAGHIVLAALLGFVGVVGKVSGAGGFVVAIIVIVASVALNFLELLVAFLQAFIFTLLTAVFIGMSVNIHHDHEEHGQHGDHEQAGHDHAATEASPAH